jgi:predicted enzyme related to lactoylglutathione lyase
MGELVQIEIPVLELDRSIAFYSAVFGWEEVPIEIHNYVVLKTPDSWGFGVALRPVKTLRHSIRQTILYFSVDSPEEVAGKAITAGGKRLFGPYRMPSYGHVWQIADPDGQRWGLFKPT